ncbi:MAG TPA: TrkH family potassium uptake protein [Candidatus Thermoplasmatota archaeon]|nr:TrkH family potassium uptake protein [Candidatus Thermoplasmatota archaeon]
MMKVGRVVGTVAAMLRIFAFAMLLPVPVAFVYDDPTWVFGGVGVPATAVLFVASFIATAGAAQVARWWVRDSDEEDMSEREGFLSAALGWLLMPLFGALPLWGGGFGGFLDSLYEAVSGVTTTGFSAAAYDLARYEPSLVYWRCVMQWLGGVGIVVLSLALIGRLSQAGRQLFAAEASAHASSKRLRPKLADTAKTLLRLYVAVSVVLSAVMVLALRGNGMRWDAAFYHGTAHVLSGISTAGFSTYTRSVAAFDSLLVECLLIAIMALGAINFQVLIAIRRGDWKTVRADREARAFLITLGAAILFVAATLYWAGTAPGQALRQAAFGTTSVVTTTGFSTVDWSLWPVPALFVLLVGMFIGGSYGSTASGMKVFRVVLLAKIVARELRRLVHPRAVMPIRIGPRIIPEEGLASVTAFMFTYVAVFAVGTLLLSLLEPTFTPLEAAGASIGSLSNIGNAFGPVGPSGSVAALSAPTKAVMMVLMWVGRLEIFTALLLFMPAAWRH